MEKGAENVGYCQALDDEGNNMNRTIMFIEYPLSDLLPKDFAALALTRGHYVHRHAVHHSGQDQVH